MLLYNLINNNVQHVLNIIAVYLVYISYVTAYQSGYILEFSTKQQRNALLNSHHPSIRVRYHYDSDVFTGAAVNFESEQTARKLLNHPYIIQSWPIQHYVRQHAPIDFRDPQELDDSEPDAIHFVPQNKDTIPTLTSAYAIHEGLKADGAGVKIGIIDSGIDYTHPALGGCFGKGCKVAYGYDLVGNDFNGFPSSIKESNDPMDDCPSNSTSATGHGTFIAGIIAAEDTTYNWTGLAPRSTIGMWRVYGCNSSGTPNDVLLKAMEMAYKAKMDVINISLGVSGGWQENILSVMADRLVSRGIHVIVASGNVGPSGIFLTASPATGKNVIAVGSTMNPFVPGFILRITRKNEDAFDIVYRTDANAAVALNNKLPVVSANKKFNHENDACQELDEKHNFKNSVLLIHQGGCDTMLKLINARKVGAKAVLIYTDVMNGTTGFDALENNTVLPVGYINNDDGKRIFHAIRKNEAPKGEFTNTLVAINAPASDIDSIGGFSSLGPTNELQLKPELVAVGGNVFSTLPRYLKSYGFRSGTSMSAPFISASVSLVLSKFKDRKIAPQEMKDLFMNFARTVRPPISVLHYGDSPIRQGAGVIDVARAVSGYDQFRVLPAKLSFNDTTHFNPKHQKLTIYNHGKREMTFHVHHLPSLTATGYSIPLTSDLSASEQHTDISKVFTPVQPVGLFSQNDSTAEITFSKTMMVLAPGDSKEIQLHVKPPTQKFSSDSHAIYGGYISIVSEETEATVPYIGMIGSMKALPVLDRSAMPSAAAPYPFPAIGFPSGDKILDADKVGHFKIYHKSNGTEGNPYILVRLLTGTPLLHIQVLDKHGERVLGDVPPDDTRTWMLRNTLSVTENTVAYYSWPWAGDYVPTDTALTGDHVEPKPIKDGEYRLKLRALRVFGDRSNLDDWDEWVSPRLRVENKFIS
ncbi:subtilisin-like protein [Backusella circina FSU 941]|nr:subtilisin-like protein [Backusella circina FSU 941]